ncbi:hypothetical protein PVAND_015107 [Polypedilum vanderplanki]|uniref:Lipase n=1 Tax=Polypedilum vanderplanki TaxID=319348 RepID=A0A9J6BB96_POLVA|nr:hypothetical protein PVAND_015107 [Polypedilum vanderplanki]
MISLVNFVKFSSILISSRKISLSKQSDEVTKIITNSGYKAEVHKVKTIDDYELTVHQILPQQIIDRKKCVFFMHGLFRNSADFLATGSQIALPYLLADHGFDVFLGNARGTKYSTKNFKYDNKSKEFWNFSWEEIGLYDLPPMFNFSLEKSETEKINYVGHSQGCTAALVLLSENPEWNSKFTQLHLLTPAVFLHHAKSPAYKIGIRLQNFLTRLHKIDIGMLLRFGNQMQKFSKNNPKTILDLYKQITCKIVGTNKGEIQLSLEVLKLLSDFMSPTVSANQLRHFLQLYESGKFQKFDYKTRNILKYGSNEPPEFELKNIKVSTYLYHAEMDALVDTKSVEQLAQILPNVKKLTVVPDYNHLDVMLGKNCRKDLYENMLKDLIE